MSIAALTLLGWGLTAADGAAQLAASGARFVQEPAAAAEEEEAEEAPPYEVEFAASTEFQSGTASVRLRSPLVLDAHFFGIEDNEIGMIGLAWTFQKGGLRLLPGVGWAFGSENKPGLAITLRWSYDSERWLTQGLLIRSLSEFEPSAEQIEEGEELIKHASLLDGIHASAVLGRLELGPLIEYIGYREENGWKGGARVAWRLGRGLKLVSQVVGPGTEVRGGLAWEP